MGIITCPKETSKCGVTIWLVKEAWCPYCKFLKIDKCIYKEKPIKLKKNKHE